MNRILLTGGAGYIGCVLTDYLLNLGYRVTVYDNLIHRQHGIIEQCSRPNFNFIYGDVRDKEQYKKAIINADIIINLAAIVGMPMCNRFPFETKQVNQESAEFLANISSKDQLIVCVTTNSGYGTGEQIEGAPVHCTEKTPLNPISSYGITKCAAEKAIMEKGNNISLRLATVMGVSRKMRLDLLVNDFIWRDYNDKFIVLFESNFLRNFIHIREVATAIHFAITIKKMRGQIYNVGYSRCNINKMELCLAIKKQVPDFFITESQINKDPDQRNYIVSNEKLESLGWKPAFSLVDAIHEVLMACPILKYSNGPFVGI